MDLWHAETRTVENNGQMATGGTAWKQDNETTITQLQGTRYQ
jgi:hypothetical protein